MRRRSDLIEKPNQVLELAVDVPRDDHWSLYFYDNLLFLEDWYYETEQVLDLGRQDVCVLLLAEREDILDKFVQPTLLFHLTSRLNKGRLLVL